MIIRLEQTFGAAHVTELPPSDEGKNLTYYLRILRTQMGDTLPEAATMQFFADGTEISDPWPHVVPPKGTRVLRILATGRVIHNFNKYPRVLPLV